ncbi:MAG: hypothetical protein AAGA53_09515 [Pseudomonadota bacterium]
MVNLFIRIVKSSFSMPIWVQIWIYCVLIPANFSGLFLLQYTSGFWIAVLGAGAICINMLILLLNGGFSKVLAIPHLVLWIPLECILLYRYFVVPDLSAFEYLYILIVVIINGVSIIFDVYDTKEWFYGNRDVVGFPGEPVKL